MPLSDPSKVLFSTSYKYFLNYDSKNGSVDIPSTSYAAGTTKSYTVTIPITRTKDFSQVQLNFSFDSAKWYTLPLSELLIDISFGSVTVVGGYSGTALTLTFYVINQIGITASNPAFTASVRSLLFVTPT